MRKHKSQIFRSRTLVPHFSTKQRNQSSNWLQWKNLYYVIKFLLGCYSGSPVIVNLASWQECWLAIWIFETWPSAGFSVSANPCCGSQAGRVNFSSWKILASHPCRSLWKVCSMLHSASASPHIWWILKEPWEAKLIKYCLLMTYKDSLLFVEPFVTGKYLNRYVFWF